MWLYLPCVESLKLGASSQVWLPLYTADALQGLETAVQSDQPVVTVAHINWARMNKLIRQQPFVANFLAHVTRKSAAAALPTSVGATAAVSPADRAEDVISKLVDIMKASGLLFWFWRLAFCFVFAFSWFLQPEIRSRFASLSVQGVFIVVKNLSIACLGSEHNGADQDSCCASPLMGR